MSNSPIEVDFPDPTNPTLPKPFIDGMEVTQGIQYYKTDQHLTDPNDRNKDNSVILVANKPAWVRVYVHDLSGSGRTVTGELIVERNWQFPPVWEQVQVLTPQEPSTISALGNIDYVTERSTLIATLNFVIPSNKLSYNIRLRTNIWLVEGGNKNNPDDTHSTFLSIMLRQTLRLRGIMIRYSGLDPTSPTTPTPTINLDAPTIADLQNTAAWTLTTNPVQSQGVFSGAGTMEWTTPLTGMATEPGGCSLEWIDLTAAVAEVKTNDGNRTDVIYYGLLPVGTPIQNVGGCALNGVTIGQNGDQVTMAHEVGHAASLQHAPCGVPGDSSYPSYEPYDLLNTPNASLGEYGLDINNGNIHLPREKDYMSYCFQQWISLYHQEKLTNNTIFDPQQLKLSVAAIPGLVDPYLWPWEENPQWGETSPGGIKVRPQRIISIIGIYNKERQIEVRSVTRIFALATISDAVETNFIASLLGNRGEIMAQAPIMRLKSHGHGCGGNDDENSRNYNRPFAFQALVPDVGPGSSLNIVKMSIDDNNEGFEKEVWTRSSPEYPPKITSFSVDGSREKGLASWDAYSTSPYGVKFSLQFSKDKGRSWNSLAVGIEKEEYEFDLKELPVGDIVFRLLAHDGFFTSHADSDSTIKIDKQKPIISILHPQDSSKLVSGRPMRLCAAVNTSTNPNLKINFYTWQIDGADVGDNIETWITAPELGNHECTLIVGYEHGRSEVRTPIYDN